MIITFQSELSSELFEIRVTLLYNLIKGVNGMSNNLGESIKKYRNIKGLTQKELAEKIMISRSFMSQIESGISKPSEENLKKIADCLGVKVEQLITDNESENPLSELVLKLYELTKLEYIDWEKGYSHIDYFNGKEEDIMYFMAKLNDDITYKIEIHEDNSKELYVKNNNDIYSLVIDTIQGSKLDLLVNYILEREYDKDNIYKQIQILDNILQEINDKE